MIRFILRRLAIAIPTLLALIVVSFILMKVAPGNPFTGEKTLPKEVMANIMARYGLDKPEWQQLLDYISNIVLHFDFGPSFKY
jgi:oligopeptide transport system permease protein